MKITLLSPDGTIHVEGILQLQLRNHIPIGAGVFAPKHPPCRFRSNECQLSPCGRRIIFKWVCTKFSKCVGYRDCEGCDAKEL